MKELKIGEQIWTKQNLNVDTFRNGEPIPEVKTDEEWVKAGKEGKPAWCYYNNDPTNGEKFGKLYNLHAVIDARELAPQGWKIPKLQELKCLEKLSSDSFLQIFSSSQGGSRRYDGKFEVDKNSYWTCTPDHCNDHWYASTTVNYPISFWKTDWSSNGFYIRCLKE